MGDYERSVLEDALTFMIDGYTVHPDITAEDVQLAKLYMRRMDDNEITIDGSANTESVLTVDSGRMARTIAHGLAYGDTLGWKPALGPEETHFLFGFAPMLASHTGVSVKVRSFHVQNIVDKAAAEFWAAREPDTECTTVDIKKVSPVP